MYYLDTSEAFDTIVVFNTAKDFANNAWAQQHGPVIISM
jgi:hypothetical protein